MTLLIFKESLDKIRKGTRLFKDFLE